MANLHHFRFPLSLLRILPALHTPKGSSRADAVKNTGPLAQDIITFAYMSMGVKQWEEQVTSMMALGYERDAAEEVLSDLRYDVAQFKNDGHLPYYFQTLHEAVQSAYRAWGLTDANTQSDVISPTRFKAAYERYQRIMAMVEPGDAWVSIRSAYVWDLNAGKWSWGLFVVYCAILSSIGRHREPRVIRYASIQARTDGYLSPKYFPSGHTPLLSTDQIRYRITTLEKKGLIGTYSELHARSRFYWLPKQCDNPETIIAKRKARKAAATDKTAQRERVNALAQAMYEQPQQPKPPRQEPPGSGDGGTPREPQSPRSTGPTGSAQRLQSNTAGTFAASSTRLQGPQTPPTASAHVETDGVLFADGEQWYTREHMIGVLGDESDLLHIILTTYETREHDGVTYYSATHRRAGVTS